MKASLTNYNQTPRKTRLVTDLIKGRRVGEAMVILTHVGKRAADPIRKLIASAVANAVQKGIEPNTLVVKDITVQKGIVLMRSLPRARGSATPLRKRRSHIHVVLGEMAPSTKKGKKAKGGKGEVIAEVVETTAEEKN